MALASSRAPARDDDGADGDLKKRRKSGRDSLLEGAINLIVKTTEEYTWEFHWNSKGRKRDFDGLLSRLQASGRRCGAVLADEEATKISQQCFDLADKLEARAAVFDRLRVDFIDLATIPLSEPTKKILLEAPPVLLGSILTGSLHALLDRVFIDPQLAKVLVSVLTGEGDLAEENVVNLSFGLLGSRHLAIVELASLPSL